jgi:hypothetical protein
MDPSGSPVSWHQVRRNVCMPRAATWASRARSPLEGLAVAVELPATDSATQRRRSPAAVGASEDCLEGAQVEQPQHLGLLDRPLARPAVDRLGEVDEAPGHARAGDSVVVGEVGRGQGEAAVSDDTGPGVRGSPGNGDVDDRPVVRAQAPQGRCGAVRQHRPWTVGQHGGHPAPLAGQLRPSHGVDATVLGMQAARANPLRHRLPREAKRLQLRKGDGPVLPVGQLAQPGITGGFLIFVDSWLTNLWDPLHTGLKYPRR